MEKEASHGSLKAEGAGDLAGDVHALVRAADPCGVPEAKLLAFGDCGSVLVDVSLLLAAARERV